MKIVIEAVRGKYQKTFGNLLDAVRAASAVHALPVKAVLSALLVDAHEGDCGDMWGLTEVLDGESELDVAVELFSLAVREVVKRRETERAAPVTK